MYIFIYRQPVCVEQSEFHWQEHQDGIDFLYHNVSNSTQFIGKNTKTDLITTIFQLFLHKQLKALTLFKQSPAIELHWQEHKDGIDYHVSKFPNTIIIQLLLKKKS